MSDFGEGIINRLSSTTGLKINTDAGRLINYTIGEFLQRENDEPFFEQFFVQEATGKYLDLHGQEYGVYRKVGETDDDYRKRIIYISLGFLTIDYLKNIYGVGVYSNKDNFSVADNTLVSDNPYFTGDIMIDAPPEIKTILKNKFIFGGKVKWL